MAQKCQNCESARYTSIVKMSEKEIQKRICKGICKKFRATKPTTGGRYDSGQGRCQTCDIWIDYKGARLKDGSPATEDSVGWWCICCNFRIRQKPRNRFYKERFKERKEVE